MPYIDDFSSPAVSRIQSQTLPLHFQDPFDMSDMPEVYQDMHSLPVLPAFEPPQVASKSVPQDTPACSVCGSSSGSIAVLEPCAHPLCSGCLTSALNIVGEKDMECAVCKAKVDDFKLQKLSLPSELSARAPQPPRNSVFLHEPLESGFQDFIDRAQGSSTPVTESKATRQQGSSNKVNERPVLRIDNVPWVCGCLLFFVRNIH